MTRMEIEKIKPVMAHRSWRDLRRGSFDQLGVAVHHGTSKVGASSRAFAKRVSKATGLRYAEIIYVLDVHGLGRIG